MTNQTAPKPTALVVCPGRGTYAAATLGYLATHHSDKTDFLAMIDRVRTKSEQPSIIDLDKAAKFSASRHLTGDNASLLIYACALGDWAAINREKFDIVAVTGNSMGWYLALACAGALSLESGAHLVNTMGTLMHTQAVGGQIVYPLVNDKWQRDPAREKLVADILTDARATDKNIHISIHLGGMVVFAADPTGLLHLKKILPPDDIYPLSLTHHGAFHSPLMDPIIAQAQNLLGVDLFQNPDIPMIDGRGTIWSGLAVDQQALYDYTLGAQINRAYDFSKAIEIGVKEFAPDNILILGPGTTMGGPVAQELIAQDWYGMKDKASFKKVQAENPPIISMGIEQQRALVI